MNESFLKSAIAICTYRCNYDGNQMLPNKHRIPCSEQLNGNKLAHKSRGEGQLREISLHLQTWDQKLLNRCVPDSNYSYLNFSSMLWEPAGELFEIR